MPSKLVFYLKIVVDIYDNFTELSGVSDITLFLKSTLQLWLEKDILIRTPPKMFQGQHPIPVVATWLYGQSDTVIL